MKFDGHVKLTSQAVLKMKQKCPVTTGSCSAPMFQDNMRAWFGDGKASKPSDNYTSAILNYITNAVTPDKISTVKLPDAVAFVDIDERWTHDDPKGQKFHFMKAKGETNIVAYNNAREFIYTHTHNWVDSARKILIFESQMYKDKVVRPLQNYGLGLTNHYVKELALALHSLQDSFSPGHTDRYSGMKKAKNQAVSAKEYMNKGIIMPVRDIHIYANQNHGVHGEYDYYSGSTDTTHGKLAIDASAELMIMGIESIWKRKKGLTGWEHFCAKWLRSDFS